MRHKSDCLCYNQPDYFVYPRTGGTFVMGTLICDNCGRTFTFDVVPRRGAICFGCHVKSVNLGFTYGRDNFHGPTLRERERDILGNAEANGVVPERVN